MLFTVRKLAASSPVTPVIVRVRSCATTVPFAQEVHFVLDRSSENGLYGPAFPLPNANVMVGLEAAEPPSGVMLVKATLLEPIEPLKLVLNSKSPPLSLTPKPEFIAYEIWMPPAMSVIVIVPTEPTTPMLLVVRLIKTGDA